jgi:hypothetical protein
MGPRGTKYLHYHPFGLTSLLCHNWPGHSTDRIGFEFFKPYVNIKSDFLIKKYIIFFINHF